MKEETGEMAGWEYYTPKKWISVSGATKCSRCMRKYFYQSGCGLTAPEPSVPMIYGRGLHKACPTILAGGSVEEALKEFLSEWKDSIGDEKRNPNRALAVIEDYAKSHLGSHPKFRLEDPPAGRVQDPDSSPWEVPFAIDIGENVPFVGKLDGLVRDTEQGKLWGWELKSTSRMGQQFLSEWDMSVQIQLYTLALQTLVGEEVEGVFVEGVFVSKIDTKSIVIPVSPAEHQIKEALMWLARQVKTIEVCEKVQTFPTNPSACTPYDCYGQQGYMCDFDQLCKVADWTVFKDLYEVREQKAFVLAGE